MQGYRDDGLPKLEFSDAWFTRPRFATRFEALQHAHRETKAYLERQAEMLVRLREDVAKQQVVIDKENEFLTSIEQAIDADGGHA